MVTTASNTAPTGMAALRLQLDDALIEQGLEPRRWKIVPFPASLDNVERGRVALILDRQSVEKLPTNPLGDYCHTCILNVIGWKVDGAESENVLDDALDAVILALDHVEWLNWSTARRAVWGDQEAPCYQITLEAISNKETQED